MKIRLRSCNRIRVTEMTDFPAEKYRIFFPRPGRRLFSKSLHGRVQKVLQITFTKFTRRGFRITFFSSSYFGPAITSFEDRDVTYVREPVGKIKSRSKYACRKFDTMRTILVHVKLHLVHSVIKALNLSCWCCGVHPPHSLGP